MAIQKGVIQFRGKVGNVVGMKNGFGTKESAFMRELVTDIKNPQSDFQMNQRAKMLPAVLFRRQLESVISRAWEGTKYGGPSTREFMKYALKEPWENIPQLVKDSTLPIPGAYLVSRGSLPPVGVTIGEDTNNVFATDVSAPIDGGIQPTTTIGELSQIILDNNPQFREGDQFTFIVASTTANTIPYVVYTIESIYLNVSSTVALENALRTIMLTSAVGAGNGLAFSIPSSKTANIELGGTVVISREGSTTAQRSTQRFVLNTALLTDYFGDALKADVAETYRTRQGGSSIDWPYEAQGGGTTNSVRVTVAAQPTNGGVVSGGGTYSAGDSVTVIASRGDGFVFNGWYQGETQVSSSANYTFTAEASVSLVARFDEEDRP